MFGLDSETDPVWIHASRGTVAARALLGRFAGYLVTDRWGAYNDWPVRKRQICWAHLIRDFAGFLERGMRSAPIGAALLREAQKRFSLWHRVRDGTLGLINEFRNAVINSLK